MLGKMRKEDENTEPIQTRLTGPPRTPEDWGCTVDHSPSLSTSGCWEDRERSRAWMHFIKPMPVCRCKVKTIICAVGTCCLVTSKGCRSGPRIFIKLLCLNKKKKSHLKENKNGCFLAFSLWQIFSSPACQGGNRPNSTLLDFLLSHCLCLQR